MLIKCVYHQEISTVTFDGHEYDKNLLITHFIGTVLYGHYHDIIMFKLLVETCLNYVQNREGEKKKSV